MIIHLLANMRRSRFQWSTLAFTLILGILSGVTARAIEQWRHGEIVLRGPAGGNRIVFCLNKDRSGIDLVCHADGRLRLAVNQWPDSVQNDSSYGKLGQWTFFAVAYDAKWASPIPLSYFFADRK